MSISASGNTVYTRVMAKVMISIPDDLLERIDAHATRTGETRSGFLRRVSEREIGADDARQRKHFEELLGKATVSLGGEGARLIREDRESH